MRGNSRLPEADAFLVIAATGGGTGSGVVPVIACMLKERFADKPVYVMAVLPFEHEETNEERAVLNTAVCLKSLTGVADAVILIENQRYIQQETSTRNNILQINRLIVEPSLTCCVPARKRNPRTSAPK